MLAAYKNFSRLLPPLLLSISSLGSFGRAIVGLLLLPRHMCSYWSHFTAHLASATSEISRPSIVRSKPFVSRR
jgi:hypothetical protein